MNNTNQKKITPQELKNLQTLYSSLESFQDKLKQLCYNKEVELRKINSEFEKHFSHTQISSKTTENELKTLMGKLEKKYGKGSIDVFTGVINKPSENK